MFNLPKKERLCSKKQIEELFQHGSRFWLFPFSVTWMEVETTNASFPVQILFSVSKRRFKHAVDRNRVKRLMRESYRLNKLPLHEALTTRNRNLLVAVAYGHQQILDFSTMKQRMSQTVERLVGEMTQ